jgi:hypothetical protein
MWLLESAKDRTLGVDNPGQQVSLYVRYGTTCLLIRNTIDCVSCSGEWGMSWYFAWDPHSERGVFAGENLALLEGPLLEKP